MKKILTRKNILFLAAVFVFCLFLFVPAKSARAAASPALSVSGTRIVNSKGKTVQLRGVSTHGLSWYPEYVNQSAFTYMKKNWKINTVRLAMYTAEYNGYCVGGKANQKKLENLIDKGVQYATNAGMYVIIDWHILSDGNPKKYEKKALKFFKKMAKKYKDHTNVIYEICNEPNGGTSWSTIRSYATKVIKKIRKYDKNALILVGTPNWSQDVDVAAKNPISKKYSKNVLYACHFYAATHKDSYRSKLQTALNAGLPVFVSEFGICDASGSGSLNKTEARKWLKMLDNNKVGYVAWNLSNKNESSAFIKPGCKKLTGWKKKNLTKSGKWLVKWFKKAA